jgi:MATE family, multidrug efflux pump
MGVAGAAMATLLTQALATLIGFTFLFRGKHGLKLRWPDFRPDFPFMWKAFKLGLPASIEQSTRALSLTVMMFLVASFGTIAVAAYGIGLRVLTFVIIPAMGLAMATTTLVGQNIGAGQIERAERTTYIASLIAFFLPLAAGILMFVFAEQLAAIFVPRSPAAIAECAYFIRIMSFTFGGIGLQHVITGALRGSGNTMAAMVLTLVSAWVIQFPLAYVLSRHTSLGARGIWWAHPVSIVISATICVLWFVGGDWKRTKLLEDAKLEEQIAEEARIDEGIPS